MNLDQIKFLSTQVDALLSGLRGIEDQIGRTSVVSWLAAVGTVVSAAIAGLACLYAWKLLKEQRRMIEEQRQTRMDDQRPCVVVRAKERWENQLSWWVLRLVNIGSGPAFIDKFETRNLPTTPNWFENGEISGKIDRVLGPECGDQDLQIEFAGRRGDARMYGPEALRKQDVKIVIEYRDTYERRFMTILEGGKSSSCRL